MFRRILALLVLSAAVSCSKSSPTACTDCQPPPVGAPSLACPANVDVTTASSTVTSAQVSFASPVVTGGTPPVVTTCTAASGSSFPAGQTTVTCLATDAIARPAQCTFVVTVNVPAAPIPHLQGTSFLAFGDSITEGQNGCDPNGACTLYVDTSYSYPVLLLQMLTARYTDQPLNILDNMGISAVGGETAYTGSFRLPGVLDSKHYDAVMLLEGVNEFANDLPVSVVIDALRFDIDNAKARGVKPFVSSLTPVVKICEGGPYNVPCRNWAVVPDDMITPTNAGIRQLAADHGAVFVDGFSAINAHLDPVTHFNPDIDLDGLHLTRAGRQDLAQAFFDAIKANFETGTTASRKPASPPALLRRPTVRRGRLSPARRWAG